MLVTLMQDELFAKGEACATVTTETGNFDVASASNKGKAAVLSEIKLSIVEKALMKVIYMFI